MIKTIRLTLNGEPMSLSIETDRTLLWVLRNDIGLTGTKFGCGQGLCGACTVLVNDEAVRACRLTMDAVAGTTVKTIEGLSSNGQLHPIQQAFVQHDALQCGYCTPGMILQAYSLLRHHPSPTRDQIVTGMDDNLCRCGAHVRIIEAIQTAAETMRGGR